MNTDNVNPSDVKVLIARLSAANEALKVANQEVL